jgi:hypothetical protein
VTARTNGGNSNADAVASGGGMAVAVWSGMSSQAAAPGAT